MFSNYLKTAFRNFKKNKLYSTINILGLSIGMAACLLILHYVNFEKSYDKFHESSDRIYRLRYERTDANGDAVRFASCCPPAGARIRGEYPEVEKIGRMLKYSGIVSYENVKFLEERMFYTEPQILEILKFNFLSGDPLKGLAEPNNVFISQSTAEKYFGDQDPAGKFISVDKRTDYQIAGIFEDLPHNSHIKFDMLFPWKNLEIIFGSEYYEAWGHTGTYTYVLAKEGTDPLAFEKKLLPLIEKECPWLKEYKMTIDLKMQPMADIHLASHFMQEYEPNGSHDTVNFMYIIALFIIIIAWVNYINLSTARSLTRAREVGLRKVVGASRRQLIIQFFVETLLINLVSILLTMLAIQIVMPLFSSLTGTSLQYMIWNKVWFWVAAAIMFFAGLFFSGLYPVLALSSFKPAVVLKGKLGGAAGGVNLRKALIVFQFVMALFLIISTFTVFNQISFMQTQSLGFDMEQVLVVKGPRVTDDTFSDKIVTYKKSLLNNSGIERFCVATEVPGKQIYWDAGGIQKAGDDPSKGKNYQIVGVDYDFVDVFNLELAAGRNFSEEHPADKDALILNETAVSWMGFESAVSAVGQQVSYWGKIYDIIGVMKNYHQQSVKKDFEPHIYRFMPQGRGRLTAFAVKVNSHNIKETVELAEKKYAEFFPGNPFDYFFLDEYYDQQYKADELFGRVFGVFSFLAIFVTSLGILGLAAFMAAQRTKEIGIRKVLGANIFKIFTLMTKDFMQLLIISFVIVVPLAVYAVNIWLEMFAVKMALGVSIFLFPLIIISVVTLAVVSTHVLKAASANPVKALRYE